MGSIGREKVRWDDILARDDLYTLHEHYKAGIEKGRGGAGRGWPAAALILSSPFLLIFLFFRTLHETPSKEPGQSVPTYLVYEGIPERMGIESLGLFRDLAMVKVAPSFLSTEGGEGEAVVERLCRRLSLRGITRGYIYGPERGVIGKFDGENVSLFVKGGDGG